jgi:hypothetical protein
MMQKVESLKTTGNSVYLVSFADPIKQILRDSFGLTKEGKIQIALPQITELYVKHQIVDGLYALIKPLGYEKFDISEHDLKAYIARNYEKHEKEFYGYVWAAITGYLPKDSRYNASGTIDYALAFRRLGQLLGTELGRYLIDSIWVDIALLKIKQVFKLDLADYAFIDDVRFVNEYDMFQKFREETVFDAQVIGVQCSPQTRANRRNMSLEALLKQEEHSSEASVDDIIKFLEPQYVIDNN